MGPELLAAAAAAIPWGAGLGILRRLAAPAAGPGGGLFTADDVSIIIPARDEAHNLPKLLDSIARLPRPPREVIVVDDDSQDDTAAVATGHGARIVSSLPLPPDWRGKSWACQQGAAAASGPLLLFIDADCRLEADGLERLLGLYDSGALALAPDHAVEQPYEELSAFFNIIMLAGTAPDGLVGPLLLVGKNDYDGIGGHGAVKSRILENFSLAAEFRSHGIRTRSHAGKGIVNFRMYPSGLRALVEGWSKGFAAGAAETPKAALLRITLWIGGLVSGVAMPFLSPWGLLIYLAFALQFAVMLRRVGRFSLATAMLYPIALGFYVFVFGRSLIRSPGSVKWKGRVIHDG